MLPVSIHTSNSHRFVDIYYKFLFVYFVCILFLSLLLTFFLYPVLYDLFIKELDFQAHQMNVCTHPLSIKHFSRLSLNCDNLGTQSIVRTLGVVWHELYMRVPFYVCSMTYVLVVSWVFVFVNFMIFFVMS
jgi:hypothetical protein